MSRSRGHHCPRSLEGRKVKREEKVDRQGLEGDQYASNDDAAGEDKEAEKRRQSHKER